MISVYTRAFEGAPGRRIDFPIFCARASDRVADGRRREEEDDGGGGGGGGGGREDDLCLCRVRDTEVLEEKRRSRDGKRRREVAGE